MILSSEKVAAWLTKAGFEVIDHEEWDEISDGLVRLKGGYGLNLGDGYITLTQMNTADDAQRRLGECKTPRGLLGLLIKNKVKDAVPWVYDTKTRGAK